MTLRVTHISTSDIEGGSARSAFRIHQGLLSSGDVSHMLVGFKKSTASEVDLMVDVSWLRACDKLSTIIANKSGFQDLWLPSTRHAKQHPYVEQADIIQFYNLHGAYSSLSFLHDVGKRKPIVWRLSDLWPITGRCVYPGNCEKWRMGCGGCPDLSTYPPVSRDCSQYLWNRKKQIYADFKNLTVVAPSSWTERCALESPLLQGVKVKRIPNGIDQTVFHRIEKAQARNFLGVALEKKVVFFSAHVAYGNERKGTSYLEEILNKLSDPENTVFLVAGDRSEEWIGKLPCEVKPLGRLHDDISLVIANNAADVAVIPSSVENLPNTALEALACGTPLIGFDVGGIKDAVIDQHTGFLIEERNTDQFATKLDQLLKDNDIRQKYSDNAVDISSEKFSVAAELNSFKVLYEEILSHD